MSCTCCLCSHSNPSTWQLTVVAAQSKKPEGVIYAIKAMYWDKWGRPCSVWTGKGSTKNLYVCEPQGVCAAERCFSRYFAFGMQSSVHPWDINLSKTRFCYMWSLWKYSCCILLKVTKLFNKSLGNALPIFSLALILHWVKPIYIRVLVGLGLLLTCGKGARMTELLQKSFVSRTRLLKWVAYCSSIFLDWNNCHM